MASSRSKKAPHKLIIEGDMTIYTANDIKATLVKALGNSRDIEINLSKVGEIDTAGLQLLILAKKEAQRNNLQVRFNDHSAAVIDAMELLDLTRHFGDPIVIPQSDTSRSSAL